MIERLRAIFSGVLERRRSVALVGAALAALGAIPPTLGRMQPDIGWYLYAAGRVLDGDRLYVDLVEVNPPLVIWFDTLPVALGRLLGIAPELVLNSLVIVIALASTAVAASLLRRIFPERPDVRRALGLLILFLLLPLARGDFGQREHLFLALALPYILLTGLRVLGGEIAPWRAIALGAAAGFGIALKPYFVLLWLALEIGLMVATGRRRPRVRPESATVVVVGAIYLAAVSVWTPEYFDVVRLMAGQYFGFLHNSLLATAMFGDGSVLPLVALLAAAALRRSARTGPLWTVVSWAVTGLWLAAVIQQKGWQYHFYPAFALSLWLLGLAFLDTRRPAGSPVARVYLAAAAILASFTVAVTLGGCALRLAQPRDPRYDEDQDQQRLVPIVRQLAPGGTMALFSWSIASTFPLTNYAEVRLASRFPSLWPLAVVYWPDVHRDEPVRYHARADMGPMERYVEDAVVRDFAAALPSVLVVLWSGQDNSLLRLRRLDYLCYFLRDPRFRAAFARYRYVRQVGEYWIFQRAAPGAAPAPEPPRGAGCPQGAPW